MERKSFTGATTGRSCYGSWRTSSPLAPRYPGGRASGPSERFFLADYFDFSIYVGARERHVREWHLERLLSLQKGGGPLRLPRNANLSEELARKFTGCGWDGIASPTSRSTSN